MNNCIYCKSKNIVRNGLRKRRVRTKQSFLCRNCNRQFIEPDGFERMRFDSKIITRAVHQHSDGFSLSKIQNHLNQHDYVKVSRESIRKWVKKFSFFLGKIHLKYIPKIKGNVHTDEKIIHVKNKLMYDVNSIDSKTKYIYAHSFVEKRTKKNIRKHFKQIKETCYSQIKEKYLKEKQKSRKKKKLIKFVSDGFENYKDGAKHYFNRTAKIIAGVPIACKKYGLEHNNNYIEKYNQDIKDQIKCKRHFKNYHGAEDFLNLRHVVKNFVNPHQSLKGKTPAEKAKIDLKLDRNRLMSLIKNEAKNRHHSLR